MGQILNIVERLNPCYNGVVIRLNPCYNGIVMYYGWYYQDLDVKCLNPCYNGIVMYCQEG